MDQFTAVLQYVTAAVVFIVCNVATFRMWNRAITEGVNSSSDAIMLFILTAATITIDYAIVLKFIFHKFCDA